MAGTNKRRKGQLRGRAVEATAIEEIRALLGDSPIRRDLLIEYLHQIQDGFGCISSAHCVALANVLSISTTEVYEVATFYHHFDVVKDDEVRPAEITVRVCDSISCALFGASDLRQALAAKFEPHVRIQAVPCVGRCASAPVAVVGTNPIEFAGLGSVSAAVEARATKGPATQHLAYREYRTVGGYELLRDCHHGLHEREAVISELQGSTLRGLGGAGFPAGTKWSILREQPAPRLIAVNIDEGEPGTFKDRHYLERDPHRFIEGMLIAAWVIEAETCYIYVRDEYTACRTALEAEIDALRTEPPCELPLIEIRRGAGAYVCGEESAMIESIEGKRGLPRLRPPYVAQLGLFGRPTLEHNMETLYWIRDIIEKGAAWFSSHGRRKRSGLRSYSVSGRVNIPGVHLAPAGISARELIEEYCGGMLDGHEFYGYFPGGASGGLLPASLGDEALDFDTLQPHGCFIGSAAVIILSDQDSARDAALNAMRFFKHESCGQCTPCRVGTAKAVDLMNKDQWDTGLLEELARAMEDASICGLGQAAPNPLRCAIKYFPGEFS
jgi:NADH:ubiquinone oxidoreductase subunit F (NADH-binding)/NADH:ubiquinone oxidoreductase subunit E